MSDGTASRSEEILAVSSDAGASAERRPTGLRLGSWVGAVVGAFGMAASVTVLIFSNRALMEQGGFAASGGPYEIAHPVPEGSWVWPVAFVGVWLFTGMQYVFANRIDGYRLAYAMWCVLWSGVGGYSLWYGFNPPVGSAPAWGWIVMGGVFLLVGVGSAVGFVLMRPLEAWKRCEMSLPVRALYTGLTIAAVAAGVVAGFRAIDMVMS
ncbi:MAG: hypothetical protein HY876_10230 [Coriobacteriales bacterium]|nr:hypothetical protein [Coriobacteriales bacterium]